MSDELKDALVEIFMVVADACDGGDLSGEDGDAIRKVYAEALQKPAVAELYQQLINDNPFNELL